MANLNIKILDHANKMRQRTGDFLSAYEELLTLYQEYVSLDVSTALPLITDPFSDITAAEFTTAVTTIENFFTWIDQEGFKTNLYKLSDGSQR